ncbi:hypothetical protein M2149_000938 [Lachnospiraceae bacterium PFB1-21]
MILSILSLVIAGISLLVSILLAFRNWWIERFRINFELVKWFGASDSNQYPFFLWLNIMNNSKLPISVVEVELKYNDNDESYSASGSGNKKLVSTTKSSGQEDVHHYSQNFPINIPAYSCSGGYIHLFSGAHFYELEDKTVSVTVITNRGKQSKDIFLDFGKNIYRALQYRTKKIPDNFCRSDGSRYEFIKDDI